MDAANIQNTILLIDDDINIRFVIKKLLTKILINTKVYTSDKGPEGLGLAYIIKPSLIILDTTLPKYSGRELIEFISTNNVFINTKVIILNEDNEINSLLKMGLFALSKNDPNLVITLTNRVKENYEHKLDDKIFTIALNLGKNTIRFSNYSDSIVNKMETEQNIFRGTYYALKFFFYQVITSFYLTLFLILLGRKNASEELSEEKTEFDSFRSSAYSSFIITVFSIILIIVVIVLITLS